VDETKVKKKNIFWIFISTKNPNEAKSIAKSRIKNGLNNSLGDDYQRVLCSEIEKSFLMESDLMSGLVFGGVHIVLGGIYDIILRLYSDDQDSVGHYVTRFLRSRPAITSTSTAWALKESTDRNT
jgi:hypothetical protein